MTWVGTDYYLDCKQEVSILAYFARRVKVEGRESPFPTNLPSGDENLLSKIPRSQIKLLEVKTMPYSEMMIKPMREDLTRLGIEETRRPEEVDAAVQNTAGTLMVIVNSVCGCAAGKARPGIALSLQHEVRPDRSITVFAGADIEATDRARHYFNGYPPSSPSIALMQNGKLVFMMERYQIEGRSAEQIAKELTTAYEKFCSSASQQAAMGD